MHPRRFANSITINLVLTFLLITLSYCQTDDHQQQQFQAFANNLADFLPTQSFQFTLQPSEQQTFIFWPSSDVIALRGMFYITSQDNNGLFVGIQHESQLRKTFWDKKIGVFRVDYKGVGDMQIIFKSQVKDLKIYLSYQFSTNKNLQKSQKQTTNQTQQKSGLPQLLKKFESVKNLLTGQQQILKSIVKSTIVQAQKLQHQIQSKTTRVIIQTIILIISGFVSIWMLRRQFKKGYELIV